MCQKDVDRMANIRPDMTEKLLTGTLSLNTNKQRMANSVDPNHTAPSMYHNDPKFSDR